jgi:energy-coupling factor transport system ATP-binding protein
LKTALWVRGLSFRYPDYPDLPASPLFAGLNLDLPAGELAVLLGQPDAGKSTLCRILAGLVPRFTGGELEGRILLGDRSLDGVPPFELVRDVGLVFQNPAEQLFTSRCESEIAFALESLGVPRRLITRQVGAALRQLGIAHLRQRNPDGLSGGEKKKLALACLQAVDPAVWILDETLEELDAGTKRELLARMRAARRRFYPASPPRGGRPANQGPAPAGGRKPALPLPGGERLRA